MEQPIKIVRGTTKKFNIQMPNDSDGGAFALLAGEKIVFGVKALTDDSPLFTAEATAETDGSFAVKITPGDTADLEPGRYFYDVGLQSGDDFYNVIPLSTFDIVPNVTKQEGTA